MIPRAPPFPSGDSTQSGASPLALAKSLLDWLTLVHVIVDEGNAKCHPVEPQQLVVVEVWDGQHAHPRMVHPLTVANPNSAFNDVDVADLHLFDELNGLRE